MSAAPVHTGPRVGAVVSEALADASAWAARRPASEIVSVRVPCAELLGPHARGAIDLARGDVVFASDRGGARFAAFGEVAEVSARGPARFREVAAAGTALLAGIPTIGGATPRLVGGLSFEPEAPGELWDGFGQASFRLPRFLVEADERGVAHVTITAEACVFAHPGALADELRARAEERRALAPRTSPSARRGAAPDDEGDASYEALVARGIEAIASGALEKVVLARRDRIDAAPSPSVAVRALMDERGVTVFAFRAGERVFLGATPELLVAASGDRVRTEAVAGSRSRSGDDAAELAELAASDKDAREHALVRDAIVAALAARCADVEAGPRETRSLAFVHHLVTRIEARRGGVHVLELAAALHPTPAMAGCPSEAARAFIAREEGFARGWYASPFGWFDATGAGELVVGIRSALVDAGGAWVFAGAGIVRGSVPRDESAETRAKQGAVRRALLGADARSSELAP